MGALRRKDGPKNKRKEAERKADGWKELLKIYLYCSHKEEVDVSHN
jgi:hypothetical protein